MCVEGIGDTIIKDEGSYLVAAKYIYIWQLNMYILNNIFQVWRASMHVHEHVCVCV